VALKIKQIQPKNFLQNPILLFAAKKVGLVPIKISAGAEKSAIKVNQLQSSQNNKQAKSPWTKMT
jgi:hypothetical protein